MDDSQAATSAGKSESRSSGISPNRVQVGACKPSKKARAVPWEGIPTWNNHSWNWTPKEVDVKLEQIPVASPEPKPPVIEASLSDSDASESSESDEEVDDPLSASHVPKQQKNRYGVDSQLNSQISLWIGDPTSLDVDAVVNPLSITSTSKKGIGQRILEVGGKDLVKHLSGLERPKTGEARATPGFGIVAPTILHSVGPRYSENYITAAENALYGCYRSVMDYCVENRLKVIAIPPIHTIQRHFPPLQGAHIAIRSLRCLLQVRPNTALQRVILAFDPKEDAENIDIYHAVMKLYFPRTNEEEGAAKEFIPNLKCNEYGEVIVEERMVRINANFVAGRLSGFTQLHNSASSDGDRSDFSDSHSSAASSSTSSNLASKNGHFGENNTSREEDDNFPSSMRSSSANRDRERFSLSSSAKPYTRPSASSSSRSSAPVSTYSTTNNQAARAAIVESTYASYLAQANAADLTPVAQLEVFYPCGVDSFGRPVIAIVGARIPGISLHDLLFLHYIKFMDSYANAPYVLLYLHAGMNGKTKPDVTWFKKVHGLMDAKYGQSLVALHILHPTFWLKVVQKVTSVFISSTLVLDKIVYHDRIVDLVRTIGFTPKLPPSIVDFDIAENGPLPPSVTITP